MSLPPAASRALLVTILFAACSGGSELFLPGDGEPARIVVVHGKDLSGRVGEPLGDSLVFQVTDAQLRPVQGVRVAFALTAAGPGADVLPDTAETDAAGRTYTRMLLGTTIGAQIGEARVVMPEGSQAPSTEFQVIALSENANGMAAVSGDNQTGPVGSILPLPLVVQVTDAFGNPISGVPITWSAEGAGSVSETSSLTDAEGMATVQRTLGPTAGPQVTLAVSEGLAGSPVTFAHTATAGNASGLSLISGNDQTAQAGTRLPADLVVRLVDEVGNGVPGAAVTWVVGTGGGSVSPENSLTDAAGYASAQFTLGPAPGQNRVDAVVSGVGVVNFTATGTAAVPASLSIVVQPSTSARNGQPLDRQPVIQVRDAGGGNAATPGIPVTAQLSGGTGELLGTRQRLTDASGRATFTDLAIGGAQGTRVLVFTAPGFGGATSSPIAVSAVSTITTITSDSPDPSSAGAVVTVGFRVTASGLVPSGTVTVTDGNQSCTGTLAGGSGSCQLALSTVGQRTLRATYSGASGLSGSSATESHQVNAPPAGNDPPHADYNWHCEGLTCEFTDRSEDDDGRLIGWGWNFGDGGTSATQNPTHTYPGAGEYVVTLEVRDDDEATDQSTAHVKVKAPRPPPPGGTETSITGDTPDPSDPGVQVRVSWNVSAASGTATGTVVVSDEQGGGCSGPAPVGSCDYTPAGIGTRTITAAYQGSATHRGSSGRAEHTVNQPQPVGTNISISDTPDPSDPGQEITVSFSVTSNSGSGTPSGNVRITDANGGGCTGNAPSGSCSYTPNGTGTRDITGTYEGNGSFLGSTTTGSHTVTVPQPVGTTISINDSPDPSEPGQEITVSFSVTSNSGSGTPSGNVRIADENGGGCTGNAPSGSCSYTPNGIGPRTITGTYDGNASFQGSTTTAQHTVNEPQPVGTIISISDSPDPSDPDQEITVTFSVSPSSGSGTPTGNVRITDQNGDGCTGNAPSGSCSYTPQVTGPLTITGTYEGGNGFAGSTTTADHTVNQPNSAPAAVIGSISCTGMDCTFTDASTDPDGSETIKEWSWIFGDGEASNLQNPSHQYAEARDYQVTLTVTDDHDVSSTAQRSLVLEVPTGSPAGTSAVASKAPPS